MNSFARLGSYSRLGATVPARGLAPGPFSIDRRRSRWTLRAPAAGLRVKPNVNAPVRLPRPLRTGIIPRSYVFRVEGFAVSAGFYPGRKRNTRYV